MHCDIKLSTAIILDWLPNLDCRWSLMVALADNQTCLHQVKFDLLVSHTLVNSPFPPRLPVNAYDTRLFYSYLYLYKELCRLWKLLLLTTKKIILASYFSAWRFGEEFIQLLDEELWAFSCSLWNRPWRLHISWILPHRFVYQLDEIYRSFTICW